MKTNRRTILKSAVMNHFKTGCQHFTDCTQSCSLKFAQTPVNSCKSKVSHQERTGQAILIIDGWTFNIRMSTPELAKLSPRRAPWLGVAISGISRKPLSNDQGTRVGYFIGGQSCI